METLHGDKQLKLLNFIDETIKLTKDFEDNADINLLKEISTDLKKLANKLDRYAKNIKINQIIKDLNKLNTDISEYKAEENANAEGIFCKLIIENLPDNVNIIQTEDNGIKIRTLDQKSPKLICSISIKGDEKIFVNVEFHEKPEINKCFELPNFNCIYSVINYVNLALGYSEKL